MYIYIFIFFFANFSASFARTLVQAPLVRISEYVEYHQLGTRQTQDTPRPYSAQCCSMTRHQAKYTWLKARRNANWLLEQPHGTLIQTYTHTLDTFCTFAIQTLALAIYAWAIELLHIHTSTHVNLFLATILHFRTYFTTQKFALFSFHKVLFFIGKIIFKSPFLFNTQNWLYFLCIFHSTFLHQRKVLLSTI